METEFRWDIKLLELSVSRLWSSGMGHCAAFWVDSNILEAPAVFVFTGPSSAPKIPQENQYLSTEIHSVKSLGLRWLTIQHTGTDILVSIKPIFIFPFDGDT